MGPSIARGSQIENGNCADLILAAIMNKIEIRNAIFQLALVLLIHVCKYSSLNCMFLLNRWWQNQMPPIKATSPIL